MLLNKGDTIGYISPSYPITAECPKRLKRSVQFMESKGFRLKPGKLTGRDDHYRSGSIAERADEINAMIRDPEVRCIMSTIGGSNSNSLLSYIDYDAIKKDPKIFIGYSDMTAILWAIYQKTGVITYYGPALVASFGELEPYNEMTWQYFEEMLMDKAGAVELRMPECWTDERINWEEQDRSKVKNPNGWITMNPGVVSGRIMIGNLNTLTGIWGSSYCPEIREGDILFVEDAEKTASIVEKLFSFLKVNGVFDRIGGLILGKHEHFEDEGTGRKPLQILEEVLGEYSFPFLADVDCCHTLPMFTLPIGAQVELDATGKKVQVL